MYADSIFDAAEKTAGIKKEQLESLITPEAVNALGFTLPSQKSPPKITED